MNAALHQTFAAVAGALACRPLARQTVHVSRKTFSTCPFSGAPRTRFVVLVIPEGAEQGDYYEMFTQRAVDDLRFYTPDEMGLDPLDLDEDGEPV